MRKLITQECAVFVTKDDVTTAKLYYKAARILVAENPTTGHVLNLEDFTVNGNILTLHNMAVPHLHTQWLNNQYVPPSIANLGSQYHIDDVLLMEPRQLITYQYKFTYETDEPLMSSHVEKRQVFDGFLDKLKRGEHARILLYGDSICNAANSSKEMDVAPFQVPWYDGFCTRLERLTGTRPLLVNRSRSGYGTEWGASQLETPIEDDTVDLLIGGFGINDALEGLAPHRYRENYLKILYRRRPQEIPFVLISTILPNRDGIAETYLHPYRKVLEQLCENNGAVLDMTQRFEDLLNRKRYCDLSGNHFNHPNDYVYEFYEQDLYTLVCGEEKTI